MANHNVEIQNPEGVRSLALDENVDRPTAEEVCKDMGQPPKGWFYKVVNLKVKKPRSYQSLVVGVAFEGDQAKIVDQRKVGVHTNQGWYRRKQAVKDMRNLGATHFFSKKVNANGSS